MTRIVGDRTGIGADLLVLLVRTTRGARRGVRGAFTSASSVVTPFGWSMLVAAPVALLVGYLLGWTELVVVGFAAIVLLLVAGLALVGRNTVRITLEIPHERVAVGAPAAGTVRVRNASARRIRHRLGTCPSPFTSVVEHPDRADRHRPCHRCSPPMSGGQHGARRRAPPSRGTGAA